MPLCTTKNEHVVTMICGLFWECMMCLSMAPLSKPRNQGKSIVENENETHFLLHCNLYNDLRELYLNSDIENWLLLSDDEKLHFLC